MLEAGLHWYRKFRANLESIGFEFNKHDACVASREVRKVQQTIWFHVNGVLSSHVNSRVNDNFGAWCQKKYGTLKKVKIHRGKIHQFLGMTLDFLHDNECHDLQKENVKDMIRSWPESLVTQKLYSPRLPEPSLRRGKVDCCVMQIGSCSTVWWPRGSSLDAGQGRTSSQQSAYCPREYVSRIKMTGASVLGWLSI